MAVAMILGQAGIALSGEIGASSSGSAVANDGNGGSSGGGGSGSTGSTGTSSGTEAPTVVRPTGNTDSGPSQQDVAEKRRDRRHERRQQRTAPVSHKVTICHRTDSYSNPYVVNTPDISSSGHLTGGHDTEHEGPLWYAEIPQGTEWGDIIPPYTYTDDDGNVFNYPGQNWTAEGQAIWESGPHKRACALPKVYNPSIDVSKTCPNSAAIGETISYSITVRNTGDEPLEDVVVNDPLLGGNLGVFPGTLDVGASSTKSFNYTVKAGDPDPLQNTVTASATGTFSGDSVSDSDSCSTDISHNPGISVTKTCAANAKIGDEITYTITVENTGDEQLNSVDVSDPFLGNVSGDFPNTLAVGASASADFKYTVTDQTPDPIHNVVTATATGADSGKNVADTDSCDTDIVHEPGIDVSKTCTPSAKIGDKITWEITVTNTGNEPLENVTVDDTILGDLSASFPDTLAVGGSVTRSFDHTLTAQDVDPVHNEVTAKGDGVDSGKEVSDTDSCDTDVIHQPAIDVSKSCTAAVKIGEDITYSITVTNTGDEPLEDVTVNDTILGDVSGDFPDTLAVGQSVTETFTYTVTSSDTDPVHNVVTAAGIGVDSEETVSDQDSCDTDVIHEPGIDVSKSCTLEAEVGDEVTWSITVTNTGNEALENVTVNDTILGDVSGDFPDTLAVGQSVTETFTHTVTADDPALIHNEVTAAGTGVDSEGAVDDTDSCDTTVNQNPAISVVKDGPALAHVGDEITYTFVVDNTGDVPLHDVGITDPRCDTTPTIVSKNGGNQDNILAVDGETWTFSCKHVVTAQDPDPLPNTATATGTSPHDEIVSDQDDHLVDLIHPAIMIVKTVNPTVGVAGQTVTYTYVVTNTGDTTLYNISVDDDIVGHIGDIPSLDPAASATLTKDWVLGSTSVLNVGTAVGCDVIEKCVSDDDDATVTVVGGTVDRDRDPRVEPKVQRGGVLPFTGSQALPFVVAFAALLMAGTAFSLTSRRRREES